MIDSITRTCRQFALASASPLIFEHRSAVYTAVNEQRSTKNQRNGAARVESTTGSKKILIVGPSWVGDMVMAQVLFKLLKHLQPSCRIDVLAPDWSRGLLERMPEVEQTIALPLGHGVLALNKRFQVGRQLRAAHYQQAIVLPNSFKSAFVPFFAGIPQRTGWRGEWRYGLLNDLRLLNKQKLPLMIERFAALALPKNATLPADLPWPSLVVSKQNVQNALVKYQLTQVEKPILALCPGAEFGPAKRWPTEYYAEIANKKLNQGWQVWLFGSKNDQPVAAIIEQHTQQRCVDLTGRTTLGDAIDLLSLATQVVSNDSGLMHIAAALQRPLVVVYGSSSPLFTPPLSQQVKILSLGLACSPCFQRECPLEHLNCLRQLSADQVLHALAELS